MGESRATVEEGGEILGSLWRSEPEILEEERGGERKGSSGRQTSGGGGTKISGKGDCGEGDAVGGTGQEGWRRHMVKGRSTSTHTHNASF